jgi:hypothetical protein
LEQRLHLPLVLLQAGHPTNGDQWKEGHVMTLMPLTESVWFLPDRRCGCYGSLSRLWRSNAFSWIKDNTFNPRYMKMAVSTLQTEKRIATARQLANTVYGNNSFLLWSFWILQHVVHIVTTGIQTVKETALRDRKLRIIVDTIFGALSGFEHRTIWRSGYVSTARTVNCLCTG